MQRPPVLHGPARIPIFVADFYPEPGGEIAFGKRIPGPAVI
jgi:hypothetical protein